MRKDSRKAVEEYDEKKKRDGERKILCEECRQERCESLMRILPNVTFREHVSRDGKEYIEVSEVSHKIQCWICWAEDL